MEAEDGTVPLDETFTETIEHYGRSYQHYALTNGVYFAPIDEVGQLPVVKITKSLTEHVTPV